jgi:hypothetical protein
MSLEDGVKVALGLKTGADIVIAGKDDVNVQAGLKKLIKLCKKHKATTIAKILSEFNKFADAVKEFIDTM